MILLLFFCLFFLLNFSLTSHSVSYKKTCLKGSNWHENSLQRRKMEWLPLPVSVCFSWTKAAPGLITGEFQEHRWTNWFIVFISLLKIKWTYLSHYCNATRCVQTWSVYSLIRSPIVPSSLPSVLPHPPPLPHENLHFCKDKHGFVMSLLWDET